MGRINTTPSRTLVFNPRRKLIAIIQSNTAAANIFKANTQSIHYACNGRCMSCKGFYFRVLDSSIEVTLDDLGVLTLEEYDELCGVDRKIFKNTSMTRKGMKYRKRVKSEEKENENS